MASKDKYSPSLVGQALSGIGAGALGMAVTQIVLVLKKI